MLLGEAHPGGGSRCVSGATVSASRCMTVDRCCCDREGRTATAQSPGTPAGCLVPLAHQPGWGPVQTCTWVTASGERGHQDLFRHVSAGGGGGLGGLHLGPKDPSSDPPSLWCLRALISVVGVPVSLPGPGCSSSTWDLAFPLLSGSGGGDRRDKPQRPSRAPGNTQKFP